MSPQLRTSVLAALPGSNRTLDALGTAGEFASAAGIAVNDATTATAIMAMTVASDVSLGRVELVLESSIWIGSGEWILRCELGPGLI